MDVLSASCHNLNIQENEKAIIEQRKQEDIFKEIIVSRQSLSYYEGKKFKTLIPQITAAILAATFNIVYGVSLAYSAILIPQLLESQNKTNGSEEFHVTESDCSWIASVLVIVAPFGSIAGGFIMDSIGRLNLIKLATIPSVCLTEITITSELTGKFIVLEPLTIDFNVCVFNSVYHLPFNISNTSNLPHCVGIKFPSSLKKCLWSDANKVMIQGGATHTYHMKFTPRRRILQSSKYYDDSTRILEFPVYVSVMTRKHSTVPPSKMMIVSVVTEENGLSLSSHDMLQIASESVIDLGVCTTSETVSTELKLKNNSYVFQVFGFVDLPPCLQISPNFGFGELLPLETKILKLYFSPEAKDVASYDLECEYANMSVFHKIKVETVKNLGGVAEIKEKFSYLVIKKLLDMMERELKESAPRALLQDMHELVRLLRKKSVFQLCPIEEEETLSSEVLDNSSSTASGLILEYLCPSLEEVGEEEEEMVVRSNKLSVKATIVDCLCDFSYQYVEFPDTPCGSYALMSIHLRARASVEDVKCWCNYGKKHGKCKSRLNYKVYFEIVGDCEQVSVEPTCGTLRSGENVRISLIVKPELPFKDVMATARRLKKEEIMVLKYEESMKQQQSKNVKPLTTCGVTDEEVVIERSDLYRAEMETCKYMTPFFLKAGFCCTLRYISNDFKRNDEKLYLNTMCKVIKPSFIHNLQTQHIEFGAIPIGERARKVIEIQNISEAFIHPTVSLLSPTGFFTIPNLIDLELAPEHVLQLPLTCTPDANKEVLEYFEIRDRSTVYSLMVSAEGVAPAVTILPDFLVCRLEASLGGFAECSLEINNSSKAKLSMTFVRVCELQGEVERPPSKLEGKFSHTLHDNEIALISKFTKKSGETFFELTGADRNGGVVIEPLTKTVVKVVFGEPVKWVDPKAKKAPKPKGKLPPGPKKYFVIKYNLMMGTSTFFRDFIFIGTYG